MASSSKRKTNKRLPKSWLSCIKIGNVINSTRFIAFKSPIDRNILNLSRINESDYFTVDQLLAEVDSRGYRLGMIVNLCKSTYYDHKELERRNIRYVHLRSSISSVEDSTDEFIEVVNDFLRCNIDARTLIGVHCMHGLNRTGYLICAFMVRVLGISANEALRQFESARCQSVTSTRDEILALSNYASDT